MFGSIETTVDRLVVLCDLPPSAANSKRTFRRIGVEEQRRINRKSQLDIAIQDIVIQERYNI